MGGEYRKLCNGPVSKCLGFEKYLARDLAKFGAFPPVPSMLVFASTARLMSLATYSWLISIQYAQASPDERHSGLQENTGKNVDPSSNKLEQKPA